MDARHDFELLEPAREAKDVEATVSAELMIDDLSTALAMPERALFWLSGEPVQTVVSGQTVRLVVKFARRDPGAHRPRDLIAVTVEADGLHPNAVLPAARAAQWPLPVRRIGRSFQCVLSEIDEARPVS